MSPLAEDELRLHLARRSAHPLTAVERETALRAVTNARAARRPLIGLRPLLWLGPAAAAVVLVVLALPLLMSVAPGPKPSSSTAPPSAAPGSVRIYTAQQLSDMIGDPDWTNRVVLAQAELGSMLSGLPCTAPQPCEHYVLAPLSIGSKNVVAVGWRDAPQGQGVRIQDPGVRWVQQLAVPTQPGVFAFRVATDSVEYLGPVVENHGEIAWSVDGIQAGSHADPSDDLYAVDGWLVATSPVPCTAPSPFEQNQDRSYWCGRSWVTQEQTYTVDSQHASYSLILDGLHVQWDAYDSFAPSPLTEGPRGAEPRFGTYLVRSAGCPPAVMGDCPVWRMVGRLDATEAPLATPSPSVEPTPWPTWVETLTQDRLIAVAYDPSAQGRVVIANARVAPVPMPTSTEPCNPPDPCEIGQIGVSPGVVVFSGWRDAPQSTGTLYDGRWLVQLGLPVGDGPDAFVIRSGYVEYLGPLVGESGEFVWSVGAIQAVNHDDPTDELNAVHGWLTQTPEVPCPMPASFSGSTDYWCGGSFITAEPVDWQSTTNDINPGGLHVQFTAYDDFAPNPQPGESSGGPPVGTVPREGTYLVRSAGCPANVMDGVCPVWRLVGRLDSVAPEPQQTYLPGFPNEINGQSVLTVGEAIAHAASTSTSEPFLVGGVPYLVEADCAVPTDFPTSPLLPPCGSGFHLYASPDATGESINLVMPSGGVPTGSTGDYVVVRVHAHDARAVDCPAAYRRDCDLAVVLDALVWP